jgi:rhomboid protease GluP
MSATQPAEPQVQMDPLEVILRLIAQAAPRSWFPKAFAQERKADINQLYYFLELLHLEGLITRGESDSTAGPGVVLTPAGAALLKDSAKLARLRAGKPLIEGDRGGEVRAVLASPPRAPWTNLIFWLNIAVFVYACYLAWQVRGLLQTYLLAGLSAPRVQGLDALLNRVGGLDTNDFIDGEYWRLITAVFVHLGLLHIVFNMLMLRGSARVAEAMWGGWRFLLIYFIAAFGTTCFSLAVGAVGGVGASGALCGVIAAEALWFWLNRKYLPKSAYRRFAGAFVFNVVLIVMISLMPGVGGLGHLGGAIFGALAALLLHFQRYGPKPLRAQALIGTLLLPLLATVALAYAPDFNPKWLAAEDRYYRERDKEAVPANQLLFAIDEKHEEQLQPLLDQNASRRDPEKVAAALATIDALTTKLRAVEETFSQSRWYRSPTIVEFREATLALTRAWLAYLAEVKRCLEVGEKWTRQDERARNAALKAVNATGAVWNKSLQRFRGWKTWDI